jgi:lysozyme family protein
MSFKDSWAKTDSLEGGYSNNPNDPGGETNHGLTKRVAVENGYTGDMKGLTESLASQIGKKVFWDANNLDQIDEIAPVIADKLFDGGYNCGVMTAAYWLQRLLNIFNRQGTDYPDLTVDQHVGPATVAALRALVDKRGVAGVRVMMRGLNALQGWYYVTIGEKNPKLEDFEFGWFEARIQ